MAEDKTGTPPLDRAYRGGVVLGLLGALAIFIAGVKHREAAEAVPYVNIELLLDNSPSMEVGATPGDVAAMMYVTPCSEPGAVFNDGTRHLGHSRRFPVGSGMPPPAAFGMSASGQSYRAYTCGAGVAG